MFFSSLGGLAFSHSSLGTVNIFFSSECSWTPKSSAKRPRTLAILLCFLCSTKPSSHAVDKLLPLTGLHYPGCSGRSIPIKYLAMNAQYCASEICINSWTASAQGQVQHQKQNGTVLKKAVCLSFLVFNLIHCKKKFTSKGIKSVMKVLFFSSLGGLAFSHWALATVNFFFLQWM